MRDLVKWPIPSIGNSFIDFETNSLISSLETHHSQEVMEMEGGGGALIKLRINHNYKLERLILGFGETIEVIKPRHLRHRIKKKLEMVGLIYQ